MTLRTRASLALIAFLALPAAPLSADETDKGLAQIIARGSMIVGVKTDYPPFGYMDGDHNTGLEIDLLRMIGKDLFGKSNPSITFVPVVAGNRFQYLNTNKVDFLFSTVTITPQRKTVVDFSAPYMKSGWQILVKHGDSINGIGDLHGKTVVVVPGSTGEAGIQRLAPDANLLRLAQTSEALQALDQGRADAFVQDSALLVGVVNENHDKYKIVGTPNDVAPIGAACRKGDATACDYIGKEIRKFQKDGSLSKLYRKWLGDAAPYFEP